MIKAAVVGASGYAGGELVRMLSLHKNVELTHLFVSKNSQDLGAPISQIYGFLQGITDMKLEAMDEERASTLTDDDCDVIFLATDHKVSHDLAPILIENGIVVIDLSGAFRITNLDDFAKSYGFEFGPKQRELMKERVYALVDHVKPELIQQTRLLSMPGCYPTASELALKPLSDNGLLSDTMPPVINAVSGVSGAGRKAKLTNSFCEVSLNAYGLFNHRHLIEIEEYVGTKVIFNPHLGDFKRGILATITARLNPNVTDEDIQNAYHKAYPNSSSFLNGKHREELDSFVRVKKGTIKLHDVQHQPFCDISYTRDGEFIVISSAIDNLLKGASSQAIEAMNIHFGFPRSRGIL